MITANNINDLYNVYANQPALEERNLTALMEFAFASGHLDFDGDRLVICSQPEDSLFRFVEIERIHAAVDFDDCMAIVMPNSIIFINKHNGAAYVSVK